MEINLGRRGLQVLAVVLAIALSGKAFLSDARFGRGERRAAGAHEGCYLTLDAPNIPEAERLAELGKRRSDTAKRIGEKGMLVLFSGRPRVYARDVDYPFRAENNFYYLTGIKQAGTILMLIPGAKQMREILFVLRRDPYRERVTGHMLSEAEARQRSGISNVMDATWFHSFLAVLAPRAQAAFSRRDEGAGLDAGQIEHWRQEFKSQIEEIARDDARLYMLLPSELESREYPQEQSVASQLSSVSSGLAIKDAKPIMAELRIVKSSWEISLIQHAVDISAEAFHRAYAVTAPGLYEYEVQAQFDYVFRLRNADNWGYPPIVAAGANATTLHYIASQDRLAAGGLLLMDCAAEYDHYSADITRTIPISGKYSREQAAIYRIVYDAQQAAFKRVRPGSVFGSSRVANPDRNSVHGSAVEVAKEGLLRLGLITSKETDEYRIWFVHHIDHWLGMNVHDVGENSAELAPGMVLTVEPGIYIRPDALDVLPRTPENERFIAAVRPAFEKYKGIGVRIEDDVLVTAGDPKVLSSAIPSRLEDVESTVARLRQELHRSRLP
jgi:Xaa-Pro aminopeptidase